MNSGQSSFLTFAEVVLRRAEHDGDRVALYTLRSSAQAIEAQPYTYSEVSSLVCRAYSALRALNVRRDDRVVLSVSEAMAFLSSFIACNVCGAIPIPVPAWTEATRRSHHARLLSIFRDANPRCVIVDAEGGLNIGREFADVSILHAPFGCSVADDAGPLRPTAGAAAFVQYTSGTTAQPKGVVVTHNNLIAQLEALTSATKLGSDDVSLSWMPLYHDMGLIAGLLFPLYVGVPTYVAEPKLFAARPVRWLAAMARFRATFSCAPNFVYHALAQSNKLPIPAHIDLSSWRLAINGAEPVRPDTVKAFCQRFATYGFSSTALKPSYGLAEATLAVCMPQSDDDLQTDFVSRDEVTTSSYARVCNPGDPNTIAVACVGRPVPGHTIRIRSLQSEELLEDRAIGEIEVSGPSISPAYLEDFEDGKAARTQLRTGDLGYTVQGRLYVVGRLKDVIIVGGAKHSAVAIEGVVASVPGVYARSIAAFGLPNSSGTESVCVTVGYERSWRTELSTLEHDIRRAVFANLGLSLAHVILVPPSQIPRTTSGKVMRRACRDEFMQRVGIGDADSTTA